MKARLVLPLLLAWAGSAGAADRAVVDLEGAVITGKQEQPKVLYIVPWQGPPAPEPLFKEFRSQADNPVGPLDRDVLLRELRFDTRLGVSRRFAGAGAEGRPQATNNMR